MMSPFLHYYFIRVWFSISQLLKPCPSFGKSVSISLLLSCSLWGGCSIEDNRDLCCEEVVLHYRYVISHNDVFPLHIRSMRHFLFDGQGFFLQEIKPSSFDPQKLRLLQIPEGTYTLVTIGNMTERKSKLTTLVAGQTHLQDFQLAVKGFTESQRYNNTDKLFYNTISFFAQSHTTQHYYCDLSNIHAQLSCKVIWKDLPPPYSQGAYSLRLCKVPGTYTLDPSFLHHRLLINGSPIGNDSTSSSTRVVHSFPGFVTPLVEHSRKEELFGRVLYAEFITHRYTNQTIPTFQLFYNDNPVCKPIPLKRAFAQWGWIPDEIPVQAFRLLFEINPDGTVKVQQWVGAEVLDWEDGGSYGVKVP